MTNNYLLFDTQFVGFNTLYLYFVVLGIEEEASEVLRLEHSFIWC